MSSQGEVFEARPAPKPDPVRQMADRVNTLIDRCDDDKDGYLGKTEFDSCKTKLSDPQDQATTAFVERNFGTLSLLYPDSFSSSEGISKRDMTSFSSSTLLEIRNKYKQNKSLPFAITGAVVGGIAEVASWFTLAGVPLTLVGGLGGGYIAGRDGLGVGGGVLTGALAWGPSLGAGIVGGPAMAYYDREFQNTVAPSINKMYAELRNPG